MISLDTIKDPAFLAIIEIAKTVVAAVAAVGGIAAFWIALKNYRKNVEWKQAELANSHLKELNDNAELVFACRTLDWDKGFLVVPKSLQPLLKEQNKKVIEHDKAVLARAMGPKREMETDARSQIYRTAIDSLLSWLSIVHKALDRKLFGPRDIEPIAWWLFRIHEARYLNGFIRQYGYMRDIAALMRTFRSSIRRYRKAAAASRRTSAKQATNSG